MFRDSSPSFPAFILDALWRPVSWLAGANVGMRFTPSYSSPTEVVIICRTKYYCVISFVNVDKLDPHEVCCLKPIHPRSLQISVEP
jgi:hypothetical protein